MAEEKKVVTLDDFEQRLMVSGLMDFRNDLLRDALNFPVLAHHIVLLQKINACMIIIMNEK